MILVELTNIGWRNFLLLGALVVVIFFIIFFSFQHTPIKSEKTSFLDSYALLASSWHSIGIKKDRLHEAFYDLNSLPSQKLDRLRSNLLNYKNFNDERIALLASAYIDLVDFVIEFKKQSAILKTVKISHERSPCETIDFYKRLNDSTERLVSFALDYSEKVDSFILRYPVEARQISLKKFEFNFDKNKVSELLAKQKNAVEHFEKVCKK